MVGGVDAAASVTGAETRSADLLLRVAFAQLR
jgi:hypothetical protein